MMKSILLVLFVSSVRSANVIERLSVQDGAICDDRIPAYLVVDSHKAVSSENKAVLKDIDEQECKNMCTDNKDDQGNQVMCSSYSYNIKDKECLVHRGKSMPVGKMELKPAPGHRYYEKFCLPEGTSAECGEKPFFRADQAVLIGFAKNVTHTKNLATCIQACIEMSAECRSAMFFGAAGECILSVASAQDAPDVFAEEEDEENVVYFENGCVLNNQIRAQKKHSVSKQKEVNSIKPSIKLATNATDSKAANASRAGGQESAGKEKEKEAKEISDEQKNKNSVEEESVTLRSKTLESHGSIEKENEDDSEKEAGAGDGSQESDSRRTRPKSSSSKRKGNSSIGRKSEKTGASKKLLQTASLSNGGDEAWGPWSEDCRSFDERRPCQNGNRVGFQSRQCLRSPFECQGPFFRYCIAPC